MKLKIAILILAILLPSVSYGESKPLLASWYSVASLKREGTWAWSRGIMANGRRFKDANYTCAVWGYKFGTVLEVKNIETGASVQVEVADRLAKRFAQIRIDLSRAAFARIARLEDGLCKVTVEVIR